MYDEAIRGWRVWRLGIFEPATAVTSEVFLRSCVHDAYWPPREPLASRCVDHLRPDLACGCGIYAVATRDAALEWAGSASRSLSMPVVVGQVHLWGRTLKFTAGYRAEFAYPYSLEVLDEGLTDELDPKTVVQQLREAYLVDVTRIRPRFERPSTDVAAA